MRAVGSPRGRETGFFSSLLFSLTSLAAVLGTMAAFTSSVRAQARVLPEARIESARGIALGTGARASAVSTHAQADNPANVPEGGVYHIEPFIGYQPQHKRVGWGASVVDSMTSRLAAGLSARGLFGDNDAGENSGWEGRLSLGFPFGDVLSIGVAGRYANFTVSDPEAVPETPRVAGSTAPIDQTFKLKAFTMDAAITLRPIDGLSISALGYNLIDTESVLAPLTVGGSVAFAFGSVATIGGDLLADLNTHDTYDGVKLQVGGGFEYLASGVVPLRIGYQFDQGREQNALTGGLGYVDYNFGAQIGMRQTLSGYKESTLMLSLSYFVQ